MHARTAKIQQTVLFLEDAQRDLKRNFMTMIQVGANMIELRCGVKGGESRRIGELAKQLALDMSALQVQDRRRISISPACCTGSASCRCRTSCCTNRSTG